MNDFTQILDQARAMGSPALVGAALNALASALFFAHRLDEMAARAAEALGVAEASGNDASDRGVNAHRAEALRLGTWPKPEHCSMRASAVRGLNHKPTLLGGWPGAEYPLLSVGIRTRRDAERGAEPQ